MKNINKIVLAVLMLAVLCTSAAFAENISIVSASYKDGVLSWTCSNQFFYEVYVDGSALGLEGDWDKGSVSDLNLSAGDHTLKLVDVTNGSDSKTFSVAGAVEETEAPVTEAPATEAPVTEAPATTAPATEAPATEVPATVAPTTTAPATTAPATAEPTAEPTVKPTVEPEKTAEVTKAPVVENTDDDTDVPKTGDARVSYALVIGMIAIAAGILLARRFGHEK